jgi:hypothetical protein
MLFCLLVHVLPFCNSVAAYVFSPLSRPLYLSSNNVLQEAFPTQDITRLFSLPSFDCVQNVLPYPFTFLFVVFSQTYFKIFCWWIYIHMCVCIYIYVCVCVRVCSEEGCASYIGHIFFFFGAFSSVQ